MLKQVGAGGEVRAVPDERQVAASFLPLAPTLHGIGPVSSNSHRPPSGTHGVPQMYHSHFYPILFPRAVSPVWKSSHACTPLFFPQHQSVAPPSLQIPTTTALTTWERWLFLDSWSTRTQMPSSLGLKTPCRASRMDLNIFADECMSERMTCAKASQEVVYK